MSDSAWAMQQMEKYQMKVCFYDRYITAFGNNGVIIHHWGPEEKSFDLYSALQEAVKECQ